MIDFFKDGQIDCKDFAVRNTILAQTVNARHITWVVGSKHVFIMFEKDGYLYIADNDKLYRVKK